MENVLNSACTPCNVRLNGLYIILHVCYAISIPWEKISEGCARLFRKNKTVGLYVVSIHIAEN